LKKKKLVLIDNNEDNEKSDDEVLELMNRKNNYYSNETEEGFFKKELSEILKTEIDKLSPVYKTLIMLYHNEELSYSEIAEITELPEGTIKNYLFRARRTLKGNLLAIYKNEIL
jgi:RNA polymerase sigma factor (sigma-70 family)